MAALKQKNDAGGEKGKIILLLLVLALVIAAGVVSLKGGWGTFVSWLNGPAEMSEGRISDPLTVTVDGPAPAFRTITAEGKDFVMAEAFGQPILITFWASWCDTCREGLENLDAIAATQGEDELLILTVNVGESAAIARAFVDDLGLSLPILLDPEGEIAAAFGQHYFPTSYFIDPEGIIRAKVFGPISADDVSEQLDFIASFQG